jgi:CubicO group peptidase (beta-lactamase class C family)
MLKNKTLIMLRLYLALVLINVNILSAQELYFPPINSQTIWETISMQELDWCDEYAEPLRNYLAEKNTKAFLLLKDGKIVLEFYFDNFNINTPWYWASAGKTLTAFSVGLAQEQGYLSIEDPSSDYLGLGWTNAAPEKEAMITVYHQLSMTSGLDDGVEESACTLDTCLLYLADAGTRWSYHNAPYTLLDGVIESATGQNLNVYFAQQIRNKTGMNGGFIQSGYNNVYFSNARSMARFGLLMLNEGNWDGQQIMNDMSYYQAMINSSNSLNPSYGYLWWLNGKDKLMVPGTQFVFDRNLLPSAPLDLYAALGLNGQIINVVPEENLIMIRMGEAPGPEEIPIFFNDSIWTFLNDIRCTGTATTEPATERSLEIYPNPFQDFIHIAKDMEYDHASLYTIHGKQLYSGNQLESQNFGHLRSGVYILKFYIGEKTYFSKIVKR